MKFLVQIEPNPAVAAPQPEQIAQLLRGSVEVLNLQIAQGQLDCAYSTGQNRGFGIANAETVEEVWDQVSQNPLAPFWTIEITALGDPVRIQENQAAQLEKALAAVS